MLHPVFVIIFVQQLYHGVRLVVIIPETRENLTVIELTHNNNNNAGKFKEEFTHTHSISRGFSRGL